MKEPHCTENWLEVSLDKLSNLSPKAEESPGSFLRPNSGPSRSPRKVASQFFARSFRRMSSGSSSSHDNKRKKKKEVKFPEDPVVRGSDPLSPLMQSLILKHGQSLVR